eukprot:Plantae.Rhodophyta-Palmaria_palmata.ctg11260.p3 GENE.Plantae.Rhodophyta-Palmaria_palmata.ctg11260~~Plantae.Rhodophyta-Palmaria_palmata.ctg11260.p3  ORF type:complete len:111 (-),score=5.57 Plantae.Rhodophyta-Palmaria_palmata.ctg11260:181-513(-)
MDVRAGAYVYVGTSWWIRRTVFSGKRESVKRQAAGVFYLAHLVGEDFDLEIASMSAAGVCHIWAAEIISNMSGVTDRGRGMLFPVFARTHKRQEPTNVRTSSRKSVKVKR